jgi:hypothetical protein
MKSLQERSAKRRRVVYEKEDKEGGDDVSKRTGLLGISRSLGSDARSEHQRMEVTSCGETQ